MAIAPEETAVIAVRHGEVTQLRSTAFRDYASYGEPDEPITLAYYFWVILTEKRTVIVDTGFNEEVARQRGRNVLIPVPEALGHLGINADDELDLIVTHAHYDHVGNVGWFRGATVHMARAEFDYWASPANQTGPDRFLVEESELNTLQDLYRAGRLRLLNEDTQIAPGIHVLFAPGHTPGELMVHVETAGKRILLTSDAVHFDEELHFRRPFYHMHNLPQSFRSYDRIHAMRAAGEIDIIVTGHDDSVSYLYPPLPGPLERHAVRLDGKNLNHPKSTMEKEENP